MVKKTDEELILLTAQGNSKGFEALVLRYQKNVYGLSLRLLSSDMLAEEMAQETWIRVVRAAPKFEIGGSVKSWILTITRNLCLNTLEKRGWEEPLPERMAEEIPDPSEKLEVILSRKDVRLQIEAAMGELPDRQRTALVLWMHEDRSYEELAEEMKTHVGAFKVLLHRAKENLAKAMAQRLGGEDESF